MSGAPHDNRNRNNPDDEGNVDRNPEYPEYPEYPEHQGHPGQYGVPGTPGPYAPGGPYGQERPQAWGTGEYDADATAFVQLPPDALPPEMPLAAPGTGQGGYTPPPIDPTPPHGSPMTPEAAVDPAATGHWTMPFAGAAPEQTGPGRTGPEPSAPAPGAEPEPELEAESAQESTGGPAAVLGQGAAAALAGSHEARTQRRPLGEGGGAGAPGAPGAVADAGAVAEPWRAEPAPADTPAWGVATPPVPAPAPAVEPEPEPEVVEAEPESEAFESEPEAVEPEVDAAQVPAMSPADDPYAPNTPAVDSEHPHTSYVLHVNGVDRPVTSAWIGESLLYVLRERLGLAGAKDGCAQGECGACSVQVDGRLVAACLVPAATTAGCEIRTVEGLASNGVPSDVQCALAESGSVQCGFCVPGLAMTVHDLLEGNHAPTELETRQAISGNLCRCSGYRGVLDAVQKVVGDRSASAEGAEAESAAIPQQARNPQWGGA
ncbi:2Fe-2S iron-sulfur cluster-binding protein [Streptomyces sp. NPDC048172]|uniref:2Fe-2S iron-sulfur cluster-binding protein n=1 Tax=Streptomyces sp. NPDC048172 TaxID=3365505 RepID=UPI003714337D